MLGNQALAQHALLATQHTAQASIMVGVPEPDEGFLVYEIPVGRWERVGIGYTKETLADGAGAGRLWYVLCIITVDRLTGLALGIAFPRDR